MKEHESRILNIDEEFYFYDVNTIVNRVLRNVEIIYVDSNNFVHNLNGYAYDHYCEYWIHGKYFWIKSEWEFERNRLLILEEIG